MSVDRIDSSYSASVQSTTDYSARATAESSAASANPPDAATGVPRSAPNTQPEPPREERAVHIYLYDPSVGQNVNLLA